jgi:hypothetical protein
MTTRASCGRCRRSPLGQAPPGRTGHLPILQYLSGKGPQRRWWGPRRGLLPRSGRRLWDLRRPGLRYLARRRPALLCPARRRPATARPATGPRGRPSRDRRPPATHPPGRRHPGRRPRAMRLPRPGCHPRAMRLPRPGRRPRATRLPRLRCLPRLPRPRCLPRLPGHPWLGHRQTRSAVPAACHLADLASSARRARRHGPR